MEKDYTFALIPTNFKKILSHFGKDADYKKTISKKIMSECIFWLVASYRELT